MYWAAGAMLGYGDGAAIAAPDIKQSAIAPAATFRIIAAPYFIQKLPR
jgi:hypothetical protein